MRVDIDVTLHLDRRLVEARLESGLADGVVDAAGHLLQVANELVPLETAALMRSGVVTPDADNLAAHVSYDTPYAVVQHERLDYRHDPGRQAKYLEQPMTTEREVMLEILADTARRNL